MPLKALYYILAAGVLMCVGCYSCASMICQHRAEYDGRVIFVGQAKHLFGSLYTRVYLWRDATDTSPLPDVTVHLGDRKFTLDQFTVAEVVSLGRSPVQGSFMDKEHTLLQYRFTGDRLTWLSLENHSPARSGSPEGALSRVALSMGNGPPFVLPVTRKQLIQYAGKPKRTYLYFAQ